MPLQHYESKVKHVIPGAQTNDILVYNGDELDVKSREGALNGITLPTLTVTALTSTTVNATTGNITNVAATSVIANIVIGAAVYSSKTVTVLTSATNYTMTPAQLITGVISDTCNAAISVTLPTVANVVALVPGWKVGTTLNLFYRNPGNSTITMYTDASTQWTLLGTNTIAAANAKSYDFIITAANTGTVVCKGAVIA